MASLTSQLIVRLIDQVTGPARRIADAINDIPGRIDNAAARNNAAMGQLRGQMLDAIGMAYALGQAIRAPVEEAIRFEAALADVTKVVDFGTPQGFEDFRQEILSLSREIPVAATGLTQIAAAAGQAGIAGAELVEFTRTAAQIGVAFDVTADTAGQAMANLRTSLGRTTEETASLMDAINHLSNNTAASGANLLEFTTRVAAQAGTFGLTAEQAAAFGSAMIGSGFAADVAATSFNNMGRALTRGASSTTRQRNAMRRLGLDAEQVARDMQTDAVGTIERVMSAIREAPEEMRASLISDIYGDEARALTPLIANAGLLESVLSHVAEQSVYAGSAMQEFENRIQTTEANLQILRNQLTEIAIEIGTALLPAINQVVGAIRPLLANVAALAREYPGLVTALTAAVAGLVGFRIMAIGAAFAGRFLFGAILGIAAPLARIATGLLALVNPLRLVTSAIGLLKVALIGSGIGIALLAIGAAGSFIYQNWEGIAAAFDAFKTAFAAAIGPASQALQPLSDTLSGVWDWVQKITGPLDTATWTSFGTRLGTITGEMVATLADAGSAVANFIDAFRADPSAAMQGLTSSIAHMVMEARLRLFDLKQAFTSIDWAAAAASIGTGIGAAFGNAGAVLGQLYDGLAAAVNSIDWSVVGASVARGIIDLGLATFNFAGSAVTFMADLLASFKTEAGNTDWSAIGSSILDYALAVGNAFVDFAAGFSGEIATALQNIDWVAAAAAIPAGLISGLDATWTAFSGFAVSLFQGLIGQIAPAIAGLAADLQTEAETRIGAAWDKVKEYVSGLALDFTQMTDDVLAALADLGAQLYETGVNAAASLWEGFVAMIDGLIEWVSGIPGRIISAIGSIDLGGLIQWPQPPQWWQDIFGEGETDQPSAPTPLSEDQMRVNATARAEAARDAVGGPGFFAGDEARAANEQERRAAFDAAFAEAMAEMRASNEAIVTELRATAEAVSQPGETAPPQAAAAVPGAVYSGEQLSPAVDASAIDAARERALEARETMQGLETTVRPDVDASAVRGLNTELERSVSLLHQLDATSRAVGERVSQRIGAAESAGQRLSSRLRSSYSDVG